MVVLMVIQQVSHKGALTSVLESEEVYTRAVHLAWHTTFVDVGAAGKKVVMRRTIFEMSHGRVINCCTNREYSYE